eukprot:COSAG04_NODE_1623_length_6130_cov_292.375456_5_plen_92_part_00
MHTLESFEASLILSRRVVVAVQEFDALQQSTPPYGLLRTVFRGTKGNSREIDIAGLGLLKAKVKEGTRPVDRLGLCECRNGRLGLVTVAVI